MTSNILVYETWICISRLEDTKPSTISVSCLVFCLRLMTTQQLCPMRGLDFITESKEADSFWSKYVYRYMTCNLMCRKTSIFLWLPPLAHIWESKGPNPPPNKGNSWPFFWGGGVFRETNGWKTPRHLFKIFCFEKKTPKLSTNTSSKINARTESRLKNFARSMRSKAPAKCVASDKIWDLTWRIYPKDFQIPKMLGFVSCTCIL